MVHDEANFLHKDHSSTYIFKVGKRDTEEYTLQYMYYTSSVHQVILHYLK